MSLCIKATDLTYYYPGQEKPAIRDLNFAIHSGSIFGFLGPSGAGKSTTQKILYKLLSKYQGSIQLFGKEVRAWDHKLFHKVGVCFELPNHYLKMTALENLHFFGKFYGGYQKPEDLLALVGLQKAANTHVGEFSKGMKMRLNFVRAMLHNPDILFLDEPTSGLDPKNARIIKDLILGMKQQGKTIFLTTHQMSDADELCDQVAFLANGSIQVIDHPSNLKQRFGQHLVEVAMQGDSVTRQFPLQNLGNNPDFLALLSEGTVQTIHSKEAGLDEVFIQLTGQELQA